MTTWIVFALIAASAAVWLAAPLMRAADDAGSTSQQPASRMHQMIAVATIAIGLIGSVALYAMSARTTSAPVAGAPADPVAALAAINAAADASPPAPVATPSEASAQLGSVDDMIQRLIDRLAKEPANADTWRMLGWSYHATGRPAEAVTAYRKAIDLRPSDAALLAAYGEAMVAAHDGKVGADALAAFDKSLAIAPGEPRARYFKALALRQSGNGAGALDMWIAILASAAPDEPWIGELRAETEGLAAELGVDLAARLPATAKPSGGILEALKRRGEVTPNHAPASEKPAAD